MKSYFRFLSRNKLYTLINVAGLVVSLMFIILMGDYAWRQFSIDSRHKDADRIVFELVDLRLLFLAQGLDLCPLGTQGLDLRLRDLGMGFRCKCRKQDGTEAKAGQP